MVFGLLCVFCVSFALNVLLRQSQINPEWLTTHFIGKPDQEGFACESVFDIIGPRHPAPTFLPPLGCDPGSEVVTQDMNQAYDWWSGRWLTFYLAIIASSSGVRGRNVFLLSVETQHHVLPSNVLPRSPCVLSGSPYKTYKRQEELRCS